MIFILRHFNAKSALTWVPGRHARELRRQPGDNTEGVEDIRYFTFLLLRKLSLRYLPKTSGRRSGRYRPPAFSIIAAMAFHYMLIDSDGIAAFRALMRLYGDDA